MVFAEVLPGKVDPSSIGRFANSDRASAYAQLLVEDGAYARVVIVDHNGSEFEFGE